MEIKYRTCAGIDVHQRDVKVCLVWRDESGERRQEIRTYRTVTDELLALLNWLVQAGCEIVALESTGVYWRPVFNLLESELDVMLVNPTQIKHVSGRKTDVKDSVWIAELLEHGLLRGSFIPPAEIRDLRDMTRYRRRLIEMHAAEANRLQKLLEQANIKLSSVASDVLGVSGRAMLRALIAGERDPERLAAMAKGRLRVKIDELRLALRGQFRDHHAHLIGLQLDHIEYLEEMIAQCDTDIEDKCRPFSDDIARLDTIPGVGKRTAEELIAECGRDMSCFPSHKHLSSWARFCPGNNESAGKRRSGRTGQGNKWLHFTLTEAAKAAARKKGTYLASQYARLSKRKGKKKAAVAVGHSILEAMYFMLRDKAEYRELGPNHFADLNRKHVITYHVRYLERLGFSVTLSEAATAPLDTAVA